MNEVKRKDRKKILIPLAIEVLQIDNEIYHTTCNNLVNCDKSVSWKPFLSIVNVRVLKCNSLKSIVVSKWAV